MEEDFVICDFLRKYNLQVLVWPSPFCGQGEFIRPGNLELIKCVHMLSTNWEPDLPFFPLEFLLLIPFAFILWADFLF